MFFTRTPVFLLFGFRNLDPNRDAHYGAQTHDHKVKSLYQQETCKWRHKKVVRKDISIGDWVLKRKPNAKTNCKLQPKWDGPFLVINYNRPGSYHLADSEGNELQHSWNADSLKKYYI